MPNSPPMPAALGPRHSFRSAPGVATACSCSSMTPRLIPLRCSEQCAPVWIAPSHQHAHAAGPAAVLSLPTPAPTLPSPMPPSQTGSMPPPAGTRSCDPIVLNGEPAITPAVATAPHGFRPRAGLAAADTHRDDMAFWMYSSGSTGRPKGIVHLQHDMAYTHLAYARHLLELTPDDICFSVPKIFFAYGLGNSITFPFSAGASSVLLPGQPKPAAIFDAIARYRPTVFFGLPTLYTALTKSEDRHRRSVQPAPVCSAAEVLSADVFNAWKAISGLEIMEGLGSTEVLHIYLSNTPAEEAGRRGQAGAGLRGPAHRNAAATRRTRKACCGCAATPTRPCTGTAPTRPPRRCARAAGSTPATASCAMRRASISSAAAPTISSRSAANGSTRSRWNSPGRPSRRQGMRRACRGTADRLTTLKAFVVLTDGAVRCRTETREHELQDFVKGALLPYKYPRLIAFLDELPKTGTGKIDRQALMRM